MADCSDHEGDRSSDEDDGLDPRIKSELEALNSAADSINKLENELQRAKTKFRQVKTESSHRLGLLYKKIGKKWVLKARPYYELLRQSHKAQVEAHKAAANFQRANGIYRAAKETVTLAEQRLFEGGGKIAFDSAWQEMLNHATAKFVDAEKEKTVCDLEHQTKAGEYVAIQQRLNFMLKDIPRTINKAKPFYDMKDRLESRLHMERQNAEDLQLALICSKQKYRLALHSLEAISDQVHMQRELRRRRLELPLRTPGVGAELDSDLGSELSDMPSASLDVMSETGSQVSWDDFSDSRCVSPALSIDFDINDSSWTDSATSPDSALTSPESNTPSIWTRFGNGLSRFTQEIGKIPPVTAASPGIPEAPSLSSMPREDLVDGAESSEDGKTENTSGYAGGWSLPESFRSASSSNFSHSPSGFLDSNKQNSSEIGNWITPKPVMPPSHSLDSIRSKDSVKNLVEKPKPIFENLPLTSAATDDEKLSAGARQVLRLDDPSMDVEKSNNTSPGKFTSVLNHSFGSSAFSRPPTHNNASRSLSVTSAPSSAISPPSSLPVLSPNRLFAKPPLPVSSQRSFGSTSPKDATAPWKRTSELKTSRSSIFYQSAQGKPPRPNVDLPKRSESTSDLEGSFHQHETDPDKQEIFV